MKRRHKGKKNTAKAWAGSRTGGKMPVPLILAISALLLFAAFAMEKQGAAWLARVNSEPVLDLRLSEVQSRNDSMLYAEDGDTPDWIELENSGSGAVSLKGVFLALGDRVDRMYPLPEIMLDAGERLLVYADGNTLRDSKNEPHAPFKLPASGGVTLWMLDGSGRALDSVALPEMDANQSYCRTGDGQWEISGNATPGEENLIANRPRVEIEIVAGPLEISEVMLDNNGYFPDEEGAFHDYVELHNGGSTDVNLAGYWLSDDPMDLLKWEFPEVSLASGEYLVLHCSGLNRTQDIAHLHTGFRLRGEGESIYLTTPDRQVMSMVSVPMLQCGQAYSRRDGVWTTALAPTPLHANSMKEARILNAANTDEAGVIISEIMAMPTDQDCDWIELYNRSDESIDLGSWGLSDEMNRPRKWQFPDGTLIGAREYMLVACTGEDELKIEGMVSAPFALSSMGGYTVCLARADGEIVDSIYLPHQTSGFSYGRNENGDCGYLKKCTPYAANGSETYDGIADRAVCSVPGGVFSKGDRFSVEISAQEDGRIYYTLDGSNPGQSDAVYDGTPIPVSSTTILRTRVYRDGCLPSEIDTQSYLFNVEGAGEVPFVISLVSDPHGLYDYKDGIMVKGPNAFPDFPYGAYGQGANYWMDWERESHIEFFDRDGKAAISQGCGIKIHGRNSRAYSIKPIKVIARADYGAGKFNYPIFSDREYGEYDTFILRASGQDYRYAFMRDAVFTSLAEGTSVMYQEAEEGVCYINGKYYSAVYVREHMSPYSICRFNGWEGDEENIDLVKGSHNTMHGSNDDFLKLEKWLQSHDTSTREAYEVIDAAIDIDNFIDYIAIQLTIGTSDTENVKRYRNTNADGKWKWILYDVDRCMRDAGLDSFELLASGSYQTLFKACMDNPIIRDRFLDRLNDLLATTLSSRNMVDKIYEQYIAIKPVLPEYLEEVDVSKSDYERMLESLVNITEQRPAQVLRHCRNYLNLSEQEMRDRFPDAYAAIQSYSRNY